MNSSVCGLSSCGSRALEHRHKRCGAGAYLLQGTWDLSGPGTKSMSPALAVRLASWIIKLQSGARVPIFELTVPNLFLLFCGHKVGMFSLGLATSRRVLKLRLVLE